MVDGTTASTTSRCRDSRAPISENYSYLSPQVKRFPYTAAVPSPDRPFSRRSLAVITVAVGLAASACQDKAPPARAPVAGPAAPAPSLPPGHPPLSSIAGTVALAPSLEARLAAADVLYLIARNAQTKAVVAVRRGEGIRFPHAF